MKGIILAGGAGTRLHPLTKVTSKQLLPVYNKPLIYYPLETLISAGIKDILVIIAPENAGDFLKLLGSGKEFGIKIAYEIQDKPKGIAQAFLIGENFIGNDSVTLILGDNVFEDDFTESIRTFTKGAKIFTKKVTDPERFGVVEFNENNEAISLQEKPKNPKSNFIQTGLYICDNDVIQKTKNLKPSDRGELEMTDLMEVYLSENDLKVDFVKGRWSDTGTHDALLEASIYIQEKQKNKEFNLKGIKVKNAKWITSKQNKKTPSKY